jgi:hypothetical protein
LKTKEAWEAEKKLAPRDLQVMLSHAGPWMMTAWTTTNPDAVEE